jgi:signal transduction histidine kinase
MTAATSTVVLGARRPRRYDIGMAVASIVTGLGAGIRFIVEQPETPLRLVQPLLAIAALLVALIVRRRAPGFGWVALVTASLLATTVPVRAMQLVNAEPHTFAAWWPPALAVTTCVIGTTITAALFATRPERRLGDWVVPVAAVVGGWLAAACVLVILLVAAGMRADPAFTWADLATLPTTLYLHLVLLLVALGAAADVRYALARADARLAHDGGIGGWRERLRATVEELTPGLAERHERDVDAERRRLASDLHAVVLPSLRRAIAEAEGGAGAETLARRLRSVDRDLQRLLVDRWPVVLETFGLVEALEELVEEMEADGAPSVELNVVEADGRPPAAVERTAWRIAQLALDNATRHAGARAIRVVVEVRAERLALEVSDDGDALSDGTLQGMREGSSGGRGIADQRRLAGAIGAELSYGRADSGGLAVRLDWPGGGGSSRTARDG